MRYLYLFNGSNQEQIATELKIDKALCSREVRKLEESGLIIRIRNPEDNRQWMISLTQAGWNLQEDLVRIGDQINNSLLSGFSPEEEEAVYDLIKRIISNLESIED